MKSTEFKKIIKEVVREVFQEELKDILLEALKSPKQQTIHESTTFDPTKLTTPSPSIPPITMDRRQAYMDVLGETALSFNSNDVPRFNPVGNVDPINGSLPSGELGMDQIFNLINQK
jgi:hypothetical protein